MAATYWYFITEYYCPVCNATTRLRNRIYGEKPENWDDRHDLFEFYDYCEG